MRAFADVLRNTFFGAGAFGNPEDAFKLYAPPNLLDVFTPEQQELYGRQIQSQMRNINAATRPQFKDVQAGVTSAAEAQLKQQEAERANLMQALQQQQLMGIFGPNAPMTQPSAPPSAQAPMTPGSGGIGQTIATAAQRHGVDPGALTMIAGLESSFRPGAQNPNSSAGGLFQFTDSTARQYGLNNRLDPDQSADAAARLMRDNQAALTRGLGRQPSPGELYLAHQQGATGALRLLQNPDRPAVDVVGQDAVRLNGGAPNMTAGQFANQWISRANAAMQGQQQPPQGQPQGQPAAQMPPNYDRRASADRYFQAARMFAMQGDPETAKKYYDIGIGLNPNPSSDVRDIEYLFGAPMANRGRQGVDMVGEYRRSGQPQTNVNVNQGNDFGPIPPGHRLIRNPDGSAQLEVLPGSPASREVAAAERAARVAQANTERGGGVVVQNVGRALEILNSGGLLTAGRGAVLGRLDPESNASTLQNLILDIQGNIGVDQLQQMRNASPTGGALGNVTERQLDMLTGLLGRLDISGDRKVLDANLKRIANEYLDLVHGKPEQIRTMADELGLTPDDVQRMTFRYPLPFDEMGRPIKDGEFTIRRRSR